MLGQRSISAFSKMNWESRKFRIAVSIPGLWLDHAHMINLDNRIPRFPWRTTFTSQTRVDFLDFFSSHDLHVYKCVHAYVYVLFVDGVW